MEPPCFAAPSAAEATSKARKQSGCYMAVVMLSVGNPRARPLIDESWCNKAASTAYQCAQVKTRFIIRHLLHGIQMMSCKIPTHTHKKKSDSILLNVLWGIINENQLQLNIQSLATAFRQVRHQCCFVSAIQCSLGHRQEDRVHVSEASLSSAVYSMVLQTNKTILRLWQLKPNKQNDQ